MTRMELIERALAEGLASGMGTRGPTITRDEAVIIERLVVPVSDLIRAAVAEERQECAKVAQGLFQGGGAHTYASENADSYITLEDACEAVAIAILARGQNG